MKSEEGFTLIELLVTVTLLSLLVVVLFGGLRFGVRAWDGAQAHSVRTDEIRLVQDLMRREIEQSYPRYIADPIHPFIDFRGGEQSISFLAPPPLAADAGARWRVTFQARRSPTGMQLYILAQPDLPNANKRAWSQDLLNNLASVSFTYLGPDGWIAGWSDTRRMPRLVRIHVEMPRGDGRVWPDLIVAPQIETDAGCVFDRTTTQCEGRT
jgi:general secretion pathway protein J